VNRCRGLGVAAVTISSVTLLVACGIPTGDDTFDAIPPEEVPFGLDATSTTTTTTTTTVPEVPDTTIAPTTTIAIRLDVAEIYFLTRGRLRPLEVELAPGFTALDVADQLESGPPPDVGLDTLIEPGLIVGATESRSVLTVDLDPDTFARIPTTEQTEAIAQIVMTMVSSLRRVGLVNFTIEGEPISVKKGNSLLSDVGEPLAYEDYVVLLANPPSTSSTSTTSQAPDPAQPLDGAPSSGTDP
jgi:Sporulation and spore germination